MSTDEVDGYLRTVAEPARSVLAELCALIVGCDERIRGEIKWNAPSFAIRDHFATTGVSPDGGVRLVLHTGARRRGDPRRVVIDDPGNLLEWRGADRAVVRFAGVSDVQSNAAALREIVGAWIDQTQGRAR
ncbi:MULTISPECIES: DUF1801 domain-containing protein [unclassified Microbacterium]|uniref:DUF1801 domain-containing protein n=1 Tax=unclassified Microbacterium TaxID=2609290 RepID=UPI00214C51C5|nr:MULTISPECIES: DUF1801 domain-containing protein [unclassified Microbacterium]MCR2809207.1 DUF1801 domain-containing protein [Microbacterium sp. zg.B185]WIM20354.1 DUF1801 domain-containing protein [Microbacterium sp. zg-B185]